MDSQSGGEDSKRDSSGPDLQEILARHAAWHKSRLDLSWAEKLRIAEAVLPTVRAFRKLREQAAAERGRDDDARPPACGCGEAGEP